MHIYNFCVLINFILGLISIHRISKKFYKKKFLEAAAKYFLIDIAYAFASTIMVYFRINIIQAPDFIIITSGVLYIYFQYNNFQNIVYYITDKKIDSFKNEIFFTIGIIVFLRVFFKIYIFFHSIDNANTTTLLNSKTLFIVMIIIYVIFIFSHLIPTLIFLYQYIKTYKTRNIYFFTLLTLTILFLTKITLEIAQILFLDYLRFLLKNTYLSYLSEHIQADSDTMITIITMYFAPICHIYFLHFLTQNKKIIARNTPYTIYFDAPYESQQLLAIKTINLQEMLYNNYTLKTLVKKLIEQEIKTILKEYPYNIEVLDIEKNTNQYHNNQFEIFLTYNKIVYYNDLYDLIEASKITEHDITQYDTEKKILSYCEAHTIKLAVAILDRSELIGMILVKYIDEKSMQKNITQDDIKKIINISKIINIIDKVHSSDTIKKKFEYKEQLQEYNLLEQKEIYAKKYEKIKNNFLNISMISTQQEKNGPIKILLPKDNTIPLVNFDIDKNNSCQLEELQYFAYEDTNVRYTITASPKIENQDISYQSFLLMPGTKLISNKISYIIEENNIEKIFSSCHENELLYLNTFYSRMLYGHKIKIIIAAEWDSISMKAITKFILDGIEIKNIYLNRNLPINTQLDELLSFLQQMPDTIFCIFGMDTVTINEQNYFFYQYTNLCITDKPRVKIYLILDTTDKVTFLSQDIQKTGEIIIHQTSIIEMFTINTIKLLLQNYNHYIFKKKHAIQVIYDTLQIIFNNKKKMKLYQFIHYFFDIIESKAFQYIDKNDCETITHALRLGRQTLKNYPLMNDLKRICIYNNHQIASLLEVEISTINKYFKKKK